MKYMEAYKRLEKVCGEILDDERRISAYIEEMQSTSNGAWVVPGWDEDLKQLKHYRWVRNQIVHNPDCSEEDVCNPWDTQWLMDFHGRIMKQTDPLALYYEAIRPKVSPAPKKTAKKQKNKHEDNVDSLKVIEIFANDMNQEDSFIQEKERQVFAVPQKPVKNKKRKQKKQRYRNGGCVTFLLWLLVLVAIAIVALILL